MVGSRSAALSNEVQCCSLGHNWSHFNGNVYLSCFLTAVLSYLFLTSHHQKDVQYVILFV